MKVCTDVCLFGAMIAADTLKGKNIVLDIGAGTGLLSLMYAQKNTGATIDAVEIDAAAAQQAKENFEASPWNRRLNSIHADIARFETNKKYDLIICNPPFFEHDLRSADAAKNTAKHDTHFELQQLPGIINERLSENSTWAVLLPFHRVGYFEMEASKLNFFPSRIILVRQTPTHDYFRGILFFSRKGDPPSITEMSIRTTGGAYSDAFIALLKDYYLY